MSQDSPQGEYTDQDQENAPLSPMSPLKVENIELEQCGLHMEQESELSPLSAVTSGSFQDAESPSVGNSMSPQQTPAEPTRLKVRTGSFANETNEDTVDDSGTSPRTRHHVICEYPPALNPEPVSPSLAPTDLDR